MSPGLRKSPGNHSSRILLQHPFGICMHELFYFWLLVTILSIDTYFKFDFANILVLKC